MMLLWILLTLVCGAFAETRIEYNAETCERAKDKPFYCQWHYLVYAPYVFRSGINERVMVMTHNVEFPVDVTVEFFEKKYGSSKPKILASTRDVTVKPGVLTEVMLQMPNTKFSQGYLSVFGEGKVPESINGVKGGVWTFRNKTSNYRVRGEQKSDSLFIQTDRPLYKPGETMRIRVLAVDPQLKAVKGKIKSLAIENPSGSRMIQWKDEPLKNGFASFKFPLSIKPVLGEWKIKADVQGHKKTQVVEVKKYVLPKFQVKVVPPSYIVRGDEKIKGQICAKYSYGKPVIGRLNAMFCVKRGYYYYRRDTPRTSCINLKNQRISGCYDFDLKAEDLKLNTGKYYYGRQRFTVTASVTESATGDTQNATQSETVVSRKLVKLAIEGDKNFKPGLPFDIKIKGTYPDGSPIPSLKVDVNMDYKWKTKYSKEVEIKNGVGFFKVPKIDFSATDVRFKAKFMRPRNPRLELDSTYSRTSEAYLSVNPWYSPTHSYVKIDKPEGELEVGSEKNLRVYYTSIDSEKSTKTVYYSVLCKGNIVSYGAESKTFAPGIPIEGKPITTPTTEPTTTEPATTESERNYTMPPYTTAPPRRIFPYFPYGGEAATRPPFPKKYTINHFDIKLKVKQEMVPHCRMLVYYIRGKETIADSTELAIKKEFANNAQMKFKDKEVRPGEETVLHLEAEPGSTFAVAAVDKSVHFLRKGNELTPDKLMSVLESMDIRSTYVSDDWSRCRNYRRKRRSIVPYHSDSYVDSEKAFAEFGSVVMSNLLIDARPCGKVRPQILKAVVDTATTTGPRPRPVAKSGQGKKKATSSKPRTDFRETWLWSEEVVDPVTGKKELKVKVPDTITSWYASGFAVSDQAGLGVAAPVELRTFKPFFVSLVLPYAVIRGEDITLPAAVFNYKSKCISVEVTLKRSKNFRLVTSPRASACICSGRTSTVLFRIRPSKIGVVPIEVSATAIANNICRRGLEVEKLFTGVDTVIKKLRVEPEGVEQQNVYNSLICMKDGDKDHKASVSLAVPENTVKGSIFSEVSVIGDLMGPSLSNIDELLKMPYGCGEQNMLKFAPNIFIMQYLNSTKQLTPAIETKAKEYMLTGYQRQLTYKHKDGSYSAFGEGSGNGSMWLTAFVLKSFAQGRPFMEIDKKDLSDSIKWILDHQDPAGCFPTVGVLHNKLMKGGVTGPVTLTAYVLVSLLEADVPPPVLDSARKCITGIASRTDEPYTLAILSYAYAKAKMNDDLKKAFEKLEEVAVKKGGLKHWESKKKDDDDDKKRWWWYRQASSGDIEMTAYVLLAKLEAGGKDVVGDVVPIVRWLTQQRNSLGGWSSTQDTVLAMQALASYAQYVFGADLKMKLAVTSSDGFRESFSINKENSLILQKAQIEKVPTTLSIVASGQGCSLLQVATKYNVHEKEEKPAFALTVAVRPLKTNKVLKYGRCYSQEMKVCARWLRDGTSNMAIINVRMVSGFVPNTKSIKKAIFKKKNLKEFEFKERDLVLYYSKIVDECVTFKVDQENVVRKTKPVPVTVYDYYDKDQSATAMYAISGKHCNGDVDLTV